jgi:hypothetical protein
VITYVVGLFGIVGVGIALTGVVANALLGGGGSISGQVVSAVVGLSAITVALFGGSILAAVVGLQDFVQTGEMPTQTYLLAFVSTAVGYLVMGLLVSIIVSLALGGGGGGGGNLVDFILGTIIMAIPAGGVAAGVAWLRNSNMTPHFD